MFRVFSVIFFLGLINFGKAQNQSESDFVRIISLNIGSGATKGCIGGNQDQRLSNTENLTGISTLLKSYMVDQMVVSLQEVDFHFGRTIPNKHADAIRYLELNQPLWLRKKLGKKIWNSEFVGPDYDGDFGNATLFNLNQPKVEKWLFAKPHIAKEEKRGALALEFRAGDGQSPQNFWVVNTHLGLDSTVRERQLWELLGNIGKLSPQTPLFLCGDLNIENNSEAEHYKKTIGLLLQAGFRLVCSSDPTYPSWATADNPSKKKIDYILLLDPLKQIEIIDQKTIEPRAQNAFHTDHNALLVDFKFRAKKDE